MREPTRERLFDPVQLDVGRGARSGPRWGA